MTGRPGLDPRRVVAVLRGSPRAQALALVGVFCAVDLVLWGGFPQLPDTGTRDNTDLRPLVLGYAVVGFGPLLWRRRYPLVAFSAMWVHSLFAHLVPALGYQPTVG